MSETKAVTVREAVGVFDNETSLREAIYDLETHGFDRAEVSLLAPVNTVDRALGHVFVTAAEIEDDPHVPTIAYTSPESLSVAEGAIASGLFYVGALAGMIPVVASGGPLMAALVAATVSGGAGLSFGAVLAALLGRRHAEYIEEQLERGGLLLWVRTWNEGDEKRAVSILSSHSAGDVHVHSLPAGHEALEKNYAGGSRVEYRGESYVRIQNGACFAGGQFFPGESDVRAFLDRRIAMEALFAELEPTGLRLVDVLRDPPSVFETPSDLLASDLSDPVKIEILKRWAYDARQQQRATGEGMPSGPVGDTLVDVENALRRIQG